MDHCIDPRVGAAVLCAGLAVGLAGQSALAAQVDAPVHRHTSVNLESSGAAVNAFERGGRMARLYGSPMSFGDTAEQSAQAFLDAESGLLGVQRADLVPSNREPTPAT